MAQDKKPAGQSIPANMKEKHDAIVALTDGFCRERLNEEYAEMCRRLAGTLARKRPSPLVNGKPEVWACSIVRTIGWVNFLDDSTQTLHMKLTVIDKVFGISSNTGQTRSKAIRDMLKIGQFEPKWTLPSRLAKNPRIWLIQVNGFVLDARCVQREIQEEAFRRGMIPYIPADRQHREDADGSQA